MTAATELHELHEEVLRLEGRVRQPAGGRRMSDEAGHSGGAPMPETGGKDHQGEQQRMEREKADKGQGSPA